MSDDERPREHGENPTQQRMDEEGTEGKPVDVEWDAADDSPQDPLGPGGDEVA